MEKTIDTHDTKQCEYYLDYTNKKYIIKEFFGTGKRRILLVTKDRTEAEKKFQEIKKIK
jgi:hypothetical protein